MSELLGQAWVSTKEGRYQVVNADGQSEDTVEPFDGITEPNYEAAEEVLQNWNPDTTNAQEIVDAAINGRLIDRREGE